MSFAPCLKPPYGEIAVVDLASQKFLWRRPLGTTTDMGPLGIPTRLPLPMGMFYTAGSMVTGGGLIFNAGVTDSKVRAIDVLNGQELWTDELPAASTATPMSYVSPKSGRQYVIVTVPEGGGILQLETQVNAGAKSPKGGDGSMPTRPARVSSITRLSPRSRLGSYSSNR